MCRADGTCPAPGARTYWLAAAGFAAFAVYGSLVPFHFEGLSLDEALARWQREAFASLEHVSRSDFAANVLLFLPLGFFAVGALGVDRPRAFGWLAALAVVPLCVGLSVLIEFTQVFFPPRNPAISDVIGESLGAALGAAGWLACGQRVTEWARGVWREADVGSPGGRLLPGYLVFLAAVHVMPLDLTLSPAELYHKYQAGRVVLVPFTAAGQGPAKLAEKLFWQAAYFAPVGFLLRRAGAFSSWGPGRALLAGLAVASAVEFMQLFVVSRYCDVTDVLTGSVAVLAGWVIGRPGDAVGDVTRRRGLRAVLLLAWAAILLAIFWAPFDFTVDSPRFGAVNLTPFADLYPGSEYHAFDEVVRKTLLFVPVGWMASGFVTRCREAIAVATAAGLGLFLSAVIEAGQICLPGRVPSVTDVLLGTAGSGLGAALAVRLRAVGLARGRTIKGIS